MPKVKFYAVRIGRQGPSLYTSWEECKANVARFPGAIHKSFASREMAEQWLQAYISVACTRKSAQVTRHSQPQAPSSSPPLPSSPPPEHDMGTSSKSVSLSAEQRAVLQTVISGKSVFFTGSAGSLLLQEIITACRQNSHELAITASTGIAGVHIGGRTLHSWAGIGIGNEDRDKLANKVIFQEKLLPVKHRWQKVKTLIIDEISMLDGELFDKLEYVARKVRNNEAPFGGITLVLSGDFCQLPPVPNKKNDSDEATSIFAFEAKSWEQCIGKPVFLTRVFRQKDQDFVDLLNAMRFGELTDQQAHSIMKLSRPIVYDDGIEPTELYPTRAEVDTANQMRLKMLGGPTYRFEACDHPGTDSDGKPMDYTKMAQLLSRLLAPPELSLKVGAQVMLVKNMIQGSLVNGSVGQVIGFKTYAEEGKKVLVRQEELHRIDRKVSWPLVRFISGGEALITPVDFTIDNCSGKMEAKRVQLPLILAWSLSTHKSQGQTLERVKVDLRRTFEKGQAYVALSRATKMEQLQVLNFHRTKVVAHEKVIAWHRRLEKPKVSADDELDAMMEEFPDFDDSDMLTYD